MNFQESDHEEEAEVEGEMEGIEEETGRETENEIADEEEIMENRGGDPAVVNREKRTRNPTKKFTYDELGVPSMVELDGQNLVGEVEVATNLPSGDAVDAQMYPNWAGTNQNFVGNLFSPVTADGYVFVENGQFVPHVLSNSDGVHYQVAENRQLYPNSPFVSVDNSYFVSVDGQRNVNGQTNATSDSWLVPVASPGSYPLYGNGCIITVVYGMLMLLTEVAVDKTLTRTAQTLLT